MIASDSRQRFHFESMLGELPGNFSDSTEFGRDSVTAPFWDVPDTSFLSSKAATMLRILRHIYIQYLPRAVKERVRVVFLMLSGIVYRLRYPGDTCRCNFCGFQAARFAPERLRAPVLAEKNVIGGLTQNARCPRCYSVDRERQILHVLRNRLDLDQASRVLHVAPERNLNEELRKLFSPHVSECDLQPAAYAWAKNICRQDLTQLTFDANQFDLVMCNHVMEHIPQDRAAMGQIYKVLKPGGYAILQVPHSLTLENTIEDLEIDDPEEQLARFGQRDHVRIYSRDDYIRRVESVGFESRFASPSEFEGLQLALHPDEGVFLFQRPVG